MSSAHFNDEVSKVTAALDEDELVDIAVALTDLPTPLGQEEGTAQLLHNRMQARGIRSRLQNITPGRSNVIGVLEGAGGGPTLMFNGHLETGPSEDLDHYPAKLSNDGWISGRGIWNMKASLAAYVGAGDAVRRSGVSLRGNVLIAGVAGAWDEAPIDTRIKGAPYEGYGFGTKHLLAHGGGVADFAVVGEPTSFHLVRQHFGMSLIRIEISTTSDHPWPVDYLPRPPLLAVSGTGAIAEAAKIITELRAWIPGYQRRHTISGIPPQVSISGIVGGIPWGPDVPRSATLYLTVGTPPGAHQRMILDEIKPVLDKVRDGNSQCTVRAEIHSANPGPCVTDDSPIVGALESAHGDVFGEQPDPAVVGWYSDASPLTHYGVAAVNYGPAGKFQISADGKLECELVHTNDLVNLARVYISVILRMCG